MSASSPPHEGPCNSDCGDLTVVVEKAQHLFETRNSDGSTDEPSPPPVPPDYDPEQIVEEDVRVISGAHQTWADADQALSAAEARSTAACHQALAEIFARAGPTDEDEEVKEVLVRRVQLHPEVLTSTRYNVRGESAAGLHLTLLFGLKKRRNVKSAWLKVQIAAEKAFREGSIAERTVEAFMAWFPKVGMRGAREIVDGSPADKTEAIMAAIDDFGVSFEMPMQVDDSDVELPDDLAVLIIRPSLSEGSVPHVDAIGPVVDKNVVAAAWEAYCRQEKRNAAQLDRDSDEEANRLDADRRPRNLLIPKRLRPQFDGRTHYTDEDERDEYLREQKAERESARKKLGGKRPALTQWELARKGRGKVKIPEEAFSGSAPVETVEEEPEADPVVTIEEPADAAAKNPPASETIKEPALPAADWNAEDDEVDYFARLRKPD